MLDLLNTSLKATTPVAEQRQREELHDDIRGIRQEVLYSRILLWEKFCELNVLLHWLQT